MAETSRQEKIRKALLALANKHGQLNADLVIGAAKNPRNVLHGEFEWNKDKAAYQAWTDRANALIRSVTIVVINRDLRLIVPSYVKDPTIPANEKGLISLSSDLLDKQNAEQIVLRELRFCESAINRARGVAGVLDENFPGIADRLESMLTALIDVRAALKAA